MAKWFVFLVLIVMFIGTSAYAADCNGGGRYEDMGDGTVTDCRTGLIWLKNASCRDTSNGITNPTGQLSWHDAMKWAAGLQSIPSRLCALNDGSSAGDWRLPTKTEWMAMVASAKKQQFISPALTNDAGNGQWTSGAGSSFINVQSNLYWSSSPSTDEVGWLWECNMDDGTYSSGNPMGAFDYVWPVRGGQSGTFGNVLIQ